MQDLMRGFAGNYLAAARDFLEAGLYEEALGVLDLYEGEHPLVDYYRGYAMRQCKRAGSGKNIAASDATCIVANAAKDKFASGVSCNSTDAAKDQAAGSTNSLIGSGSSIASDS